MTEEPKPEENPIGFVISINDDISASDFIEFTDFLSSREYVKGIEKLFINPEIQLQRMKIRQEVKKRIMEKIIEVFEAMD